MKKKTKKAEKVIDVEPGEEVEQYLDYNQKHVTINNYGGFVNLIQRGKPSEPPKPPRP